jgi:predicted site-specific integrase-resolvase
MMSAKVVQENDLTPKQEKAIQALLTHPTMEEAAEAAGVNRVTLFRWLQQGEFQAAYTKARRESVRQAIARLQNRSGEAVEVLAEIMSDITNAPSARVSAAKAIIEYSIEAVEVEDLAERLAELESLFKIQAEQIELNKKASGKQ